MAQSNFFQPGFDEQVESQNIERQRQYAQLLRQQSEQSPQGQMVSGRYVAPSFTQGLAQMLKAYQGGKGMREADARQKALAEAVRGRQTEEMGQFAKLMGGAPAQATGQTYQTGANEMGDEAATVPQYSGAQKPDINAAYQYASQARTPGLQQVGIQGTMQMAQERAKQEAAAAQQQRMLAVLQSAPGPQQAIAAGVPPEMVKQFYESKNYGRDEVTFQDVGGEKVPVTKFGDRPEGIASLQKTGNPFSDLVVRDPTSGNIVPNAPLAQVKGDIASKGAARMSVTNRIENKAAENIAGQVGPMLKESATAAEGAVRVLDSANRVIAAVDSGKMVSGPLANVRVSARQAAELLGVGGKDNAEVLQNTRAAIRGLAEMTLQGRKQMSGQGAITESESKLAEKAMSGDISDLTPAEIKQLAQASSRASQWTIQTHKSKTDAAAKLPGMDGLMPFFNTPAMADPAAPASSNGITIRRLD